MALLCKRCYADVTEDIALMEPKRKFRCKCGSGMFVQQNDEPEVPYSLTSNDKKLFLRRVGIASEE